MSNQKFRRTVAVVQIMMFILFGILVGLGGVKIAQLSFQLFTM